MNADTKLFDSAALGIVFDGPQRRVRVGEGGSRSRIAQFIRMVRRVPEVMVRITGSGKRMGQIRAHMVYITRNGKLEAENERGAKVLGRAELEQVMVEWGYMDQGYRKPRALSVNVMLSMPAGTASRGVWLAARDFAEERFSQHQYLMVLHTDTPHPHVHIAVKAQGFNLQWLKRSKTDLQAWRELFAQKLRNHGIAAEATPRRARGMQRRSLSQARHHLSRAPWRSEQIRRQVEDAIADLAASNDKPLPDDNDLRLLARHASLRAAFLKIANDMRRVASVKRTRLADDIERFVSTMPPIESDRQRIRREVTEFYTQDAANQKARVPDQATTHLTLDRSR